MNDWPASPLEPAGDAPTVHLGSRSRAEPHGSVAIIPAAPARLPAAQAAHAAEVRMGRQRRFTDSGGNEWTLAARRGGAVLRHDRGGRAAPTSHLAEGFRSERRPPLSRHR
jgi:hypothetical protein